jgi:hypothetical protein
MTDKKIVLDEVLARWKQNAEDFRIYDANDGDGFCLRNPRGFAVMGSDLEGWIRGAVECLNDIPKSVSIAHAYRDCYEQQRVITGEVEIMRDFSEVRFALAEDALKDIGNGTFGTTKRAGPLARDTLAKLNDGTKSIKDWAALKPAHA